MLSDICRDQMHRFYQPKSSNGECFCIKSCSMTSHFQRWKIFCLRSAAVILKDELFCCYWSNTLRWLESCESASAEIWLDGVIKSAATVTFFTDTLISTALIVHEGPSVFRIFHRWQAVNQQWKVLNYDKSLDSDDLKDVTVDRTGPQPGQGYQTGIGVSTSTSSLMVVASTAAGSTSTTVVTSAGAFGAHVDPGIDITVPDQHCPYSILHLLSHLRQPETRSQPSNSTRELVMRVTTVWWVSWGLISLGISLGGKRFLQLTLSRNYCLKSFGLIQCSWLFSNTSLMSLHELNKSWSGLICRLEWNIFIWMNYVVSLQIY